MQPEGFVHLLLAHCVFMCKQRYQGIWGTCHNFLISVLSVLVIITFIDKNPTSIAFTLTKEKIPYIPLEIVLVPYMPLKNVVSHDEK